MWVGARRESRGGYMQCHRIAARPCADPGDLTRFGYFVFARYFVLKFERKGYE